MDHHARAVDLLLQGIFDTVANHMGIADAHIRRNNQMKLDEGDTARNTGLQIMNLDGAARIGRARWGSWWDA